MTQDSYARRGITRAIHYADVLSTISGRASAWLIVVLTAVISYEVFSRYVLSSPHDWVFDASYMLYGALFMMTGAYALSQNAHVRGDFMYGAFSPRLQAGIDLVLYLLFFVPGVVALVWAGYTFAAESWAIREGSPLTPDGPPQYPFKTVIPIAGALLLVQGLGEILRCVLCLRTGAWPARMSDIKEVDVDKLRAALPKAVRSGADA